MADVLDRRVCLADSSFHRGPFDLNIGPKKRILRNRQLLYCAPCFPQCILLASKSRVCVGQETALENASWNFIDQRFKQRHRCLVLLSCPRGLIECLVDAIDQRLALFLGLTET